MIRVLTVEDSPTLRRLLRDILSLDPDFEIAGEAGHGLRAVEMCHRLAPDLVMMDMRMPRASGFEAIRRIMDECPRAIVSLADPTDEREVQMTFAALEAGALCPLGRPAGLPGKDPVAARLLPMLKAIAGVKVVRRHRRGKLALFDRGYGALLAATPIGGRRTARIFVISAGVGGPSAVQTVLSGLPAGVCPPLLIVQHISPGFVKGMARWLDRTTPLKVAVAVNGRTVRAGRAYLAPDNRNLTIDRAGRTCLAGPASNQECVPSADALFASAAGAFGRDAAGVVLTGMGGDGAEGLKAVRAAGGLTIAQDEPTSVIFDMPRRAISLRGAEYVMPLEAIAPRLDEAIGVEATGL